MNREVVTRAAVGTYMGPGLSSKAFPKISLSSFHDVKAGVF